MTKDPPKKYKGYCKLPRCQKYFETNQPQKSFCEPKHQAEYWIEVRGGRINVQKKVDDQEELIKEIIRRLDDHEKRLKTIEGVLKLASIEEVADPNFLRKKFGVPE